MQIYSLNCNPYQGVSYSQLTKQQQNILRFHFNVLKYVSELFLKKNSRKGNDEISPGDMKYIPMMKFLKIDPVISMRINTFSSEWILM